MRATIYFKNSKILPCMIYAMLSLRQKLKNRKGYISGDKVKPETLKSIIKLPLLSILNKKRSQARENGWPVTLPASNLSHLSVPKLPKICLLWSIPRLRTRYVIYSSRFFFVGIFPHFTFIFSYKSEILCY